MQQQTLSPDGRWRWDGQRWIPVGPAPPPWASPPAAAPVPAGVPSGVDLKAPAWLSETAENPDWLPPSSQIRLPAFHPAAAAPAKAPAGSRFKPVLLVGMAVLLIVLTVASVALLVRPGLVP